MINDAVVMKNRIFLGENQIAGISNTIFITGSPRSGTTLVGKYVASFENIEYHYEPPLLYLLTSMAASDSIDPNIATDILRLYLYEDLLVESVHGRKVNLRPNDDSSILQTMTWRELNRRWQVITNRQKAIEEISQKNLRLAVKMPSIMNAIKFLRGGFTKSSIIIVLRNGRFVVQSILKKGWLKDENLSREYWPYKVSSTSEKKIPYFVKSDEEKRWAAMNETTRACFVWRKDAEATLEFFRNRNDYPNLIFIRYEDLLDNPLLAVSALSKTLGHPFSDITDVLIKNTKEPSSMKENSDLELLFRNVETDELERFNYINEQLGYQSI